MTALADPWEHARVAQYIETHKFNKLTLQFPDDLLQHASTVAQDLQRLLQQNNSPAQVYVLADTSYNPLSIDEVAAAHVKADCVVHYGYASLHPVSRTPALCVLPKQQLNVQETSTWLVQQLAHLHEEVQSASTQQQQQQQQEEAPPVCVICTEQGYLHQLPELQQAVLQAYNGPLQLVFAQSAATELWPQHTKAAVAGVGPAAAAPDCCQAATVGSSPGTASSAAATTVEAAHSHEATDAAQQSGVPRAAGTDVPVGGLVWQLPGSNGSSSSSSCPVHMVWLGPPASTALTHLQLSHASCPWLMLNPDGQGVAVGLSPGLDRLLKRRYYMVERARGASMVGLLLGTLGAAGYKTALEQLRRLAAKAGKKTYTLLMGKPNPAKLANFPELEVFVMLADPQGLILDSKEYLHPIITPHEAYLAFTGQDFDVAKYRLDFRDLLQLDQQTGSQQQPVLSARASGDLSLAGNVTDIDGSDEGDEDSIQQLAAVAGALTVAGTTTSSGTLAGNQTGKQVHSAAQYLTHRRTFQGLETPATGAAILPAAVAVQGRCGRAAVYQDEPQQ